MPKKMTLIYLKYFLENISSLSHHIMKGKRRKNKFHPITDHQIFFFWKTKKNPNLPTLKNNQTSPSHAIQKHNSLE
jgi:hypothetical protein